jgi:catechol 2,3-dioxygenase-like lactoylglutathione lyase family enzyme
METTMPDPETSARGTRLHHVGVTVPDLDRSIRFYADVFGAELEWDLTVEGDAAAGLTRVPGADLRFVSLRFAHGSIELFEFRGGAPGRPNDRALNDVGVHHLCLEVDDIEAVHRRLVELDLPCWTEPQLIEEGSLAGLRFFMFEDPDGQLVEILQPPA